MFPFIFLKFASCICPQVHGLPYNDISSWTVPTYWICWWGILFYIVFLCIRSRHTLPSSLSGVSEIVFIFFLPTIQGNLVLPTLYIGREMSEAICLCLHDFVYVYAWEGMASSSLPTSPCVIPAGFVVSSFTGLLNSFCLSFVPHNLKFFWWDP